MGIRYHNVAIVEAGELFVSAAGGTVYFESQQRNVVVSMDDLAPVSDD